MAVGATPAPPAENVKGDLSAALASVTGSASNFTARGFSAPARVYPRRLFMGGDDPKIGYWSNVFGGLANGQVNCTLRAGLNYHFHLITASATAPGSLAVFAAIRLASSFVSNFATDSVDRRHIARLYSPSQGSQSKEWPSPVAD